MEDLGFRPLSVIGTLVGLLIIIGALVFLVLSILTPFYVYMTARWTKKCSEWLQRCYEQLYQANQHSRSQGQETLPKQENHT